MVSKAKRVHAYVWSALAAAALLAFLLIGYLNADVGGIGIVICFPIFVFSFVSCLILGNNFIGDMVLEIFSWGFVKMPGLIFTLDLDGLIWLLTVKLLFWVIGLILATICGILAIALGLIVSVFVYPSAIIKNIRGIEENV